MPLRQILSVNHSTCYLEILIDLDHEQLVEVPGGIDLHNILCLERGNRLYFDVVVAKSSVSALRVGFVKLDAIRDGAEKFTDVAVDGEMKTSLPVLAFRKRYQILKVGDH